MEGSETLFFSLQNIYTVRKKIASKFREIWARALSKFRQACLMTE